MANYPDVTPAGKLNKRLHFQSKSGTPNSFGEVTTWVTYATLWGSIDALRGQLLYQTNEFIESSTYTIKIRYNPSLNIGVNDRIVCDGQTFLIKSLLDKNMQHREIQILASVLNEVM